MITDVLQPTHLIFILVVALLVLGPKRLPEVGRSLGKGIRDFRGAMAGIEEHTSGMLDPGAPTAATPPPPITAATVSPEVSQTVPTVMETTVSEMTVTPHPEVAEPLPLPTPAATEQRSAPTPPPEFDTDEPHPSDYAD